MSQPSFPCKNVGMRFTIGIKETLKVTKEKSTEHNVNNNVSIHFNLEKWKKMIKIFRKLNHKHKEDLEREPSPMTVNEQQTSPNKARDQIVRLLCS